jgi:hypothetical protein
MMKSYLSSVSSDRPKQQSAPIKTRPERVASLPIVRHHVLRVKLSGAFRKARTSRFRRRCASALMSAGQSSSTVIVRASI